MLRVTLWVSVLVLHAAVRSSEGIKRTTKIQYASAIQTENGNLQIVEGKQARAVAWGSFQDDVAKDGWSYLEIRTNPSMDDEETAYAAGAIEANLTRSFIDAHLHNLYTDYCRNNTEYCAKVTAYFQAQLAWMNERSLEQRDLSVFWNQVHLMLKQLAGLDDSYRNRSLNSRNVYETVNQLYFVNTEGAFYDLEPAFGRVPDNASLSLTSPCSMLVKKTSNDFLVGHTTWWKYLSMLRIQKRYSFKYGFTSNAWYRIPGHTITMPSYPGKLSSMDDFYVISTGLVVTETTNNIYNRNLYQSLKTETVPTSIRAMVANRVALDGRHWTREFEKHNSGTYNNQWVIIDYKKASEVITDHVINQTEQTIVLGNETMWMIEQLPTRMVSRDMTDVLTEKGYWASYNVPYFPQIYNESGYLDMFKRHGDHYSHDACSRAKIFERDQFRVDDAASMISMLRYNDFQKDPLSRCNCTPPYSPTYAIAARYDLIDPNGTYDDDDITWRAEGATDVKVANIDSIRDLSFLAICGPTSDQQPIFSWSKSGFNISPYGHPDVFDFRPVRHRWTL